MKIKFTKMHGLGNDFIIINALNQHIDLSLEQIRNLADRHLGVGCDQIIIILPKKDQKADFSFRLFNADGTEAEQSGNGMRCVAKFIKENNLLTKNIIFMHSVLANKITKLILEPDGTIAVDMGIPVWEPKLIPLIASDFALRYNLQVEGKNFIFGAVNFGNPHIVIKVEDVNAVDVLHWGKLLAQHKNFPNGVNVGFMQIVNRKEIRLRVYERGTGETLSCGSGSVAAVTVGRLWQLLDENVLVQLSGGSLTVSCPNIESAVILKGPAVKVFDGEVELGDF